MPQVKHSSPTTPSSQVQNPVHPYSPGDRVHHPQVHQARYQHLPSETAHQHAEGAPDSRSYRHPTGTHVRIHTWARTHPVGTGRAAACGILFSGSGDRDRTREQVPTPNPTVQPPNNDHPLTPWASVPVNTELCHSPVSLPPSAEPLPCESRRDPAREARQGEPPLTRRGSRGGEQSPASQQPGPRRLGAALPAGEEPRDPSQRLL